MTKKSDTIQPKTVPLAFVFNSPVLVPWSVVKDHQDDPEEMADKIERWQAVNVGTYRLKENQEVVEANNPTLKMTIRRILREKDKTGEKNEKGEPKQRLIGFECYWFVSVDEASAQAALMSMRANRRVPANIPEE